jgi:hypothetical protein
MAKLRKKYPMYATGTGPHGIGNAYLETPSGELAQNDINVAAGMEAAATNPWTKGMSILGQMAMNYGIKNFKGFNFGQEEEATPAPVMAYGGGVGQRNVNVEGDEVGQMPDGKTFEFKGPSHEEGGIDTNLPVGTDIFSDRIKIKGKSMADRKKARIKSVTALEKKLEKNPTDKVLHNTLERVMMNNEKEELKDKKIQQVVGAIQKGFAGQFAFGTGLDGVDPTIPPGTDPVLSVGTGIPIGDVMPEKFQGKYVHHAPTTVLNDEEAYYRTFNDVIRNIFSTEKSRLNADRGLVTTVFANGGTVGEDGVTTNPDGTPVEPVEPTVIETYEGADNYTEYQNYLKQKQIYDTYNAENTQASQTLGAGQPVTVDEFKSTPGFTDFTLPEGATGLVKYKGTDYTPSSKIEGNFYTRTDTGEIYIPVYENPGDKNYAVVDSPAVKEQKYLQQAWQQETANIQGYVRNTYYDPECNCNRVEQIPLPVGQDIPTNGTFVPKGDMPPPDWRPKEPIPTFANGGTVGGIPPFDVNALMNVLNQLNQVQNLNADSFNLDYANTPKLGDPEQPSQGLPPGGIKTNFINADVPEEASGLKFMEEIPEDPFVLDPTTYATEDKKGTGKVADYLNKISNNPNSQITPGNIMGLVGNAISSLAPLTTTLQNRAGDTPNVNYMLNYGDRGLETIDKSKKFVTGTRDTNLKSLEQNKEGARKLNRNSARSLNTKRALDLGVEIAGNEAENQIYSNFANIMAGILGQEAGLQNQQDQVVMSGEANRDIADRQDRDNFYTNMGIGKAAIGEGLQETGKDINAMKQQEVMMNLLNQLSKYGITIDSSGNLGSNG